MNFHNCLLSLSFSVNCSLSTWTSLRKIWWRLLFKVGWRWIISCILILVSERCLSCLSSLFANLRHVSFILRVLDYIRCVITWIIVFIVTHILITRSSSIIIVIVIIVILTIQLIIKPISFICTLRQLILWIVLLLLRIKRRNWIIVRLNLVVTWLVVNVSIFGRIISWKLILIDLLLLTSISTTATKTILLLWHYYFNNFYF